MNHLKIYEKIIHNAKYQNRIRESYYERKKKNFSNVYYENHHILPKCMDGENNLENLVLLTAKEHFICHKLLTYIYPNNSRIVFAFHRMAFSKTTKHHISTRDYEYARH